MSLYGKTKRDLYNGYGDFKKGSDCIIERVWVEDADIYAKITIGENKPMILRLEDIDYKGTKRAFKVTGEINALDSFDGK